MTEVDELFDIKNAYYTGNYQACINEAQKFRTTGKIDMSSWFRKSYNRSIDYEGAYGCYNSWLIYVSDADLAIERDIFLYRSYLALKKYGIVRDEIKAGSPELLAPLKTLAAYLSAGEGAKKVKYWSNYFLQSIKMFPSETIKIFTSHLFIPGYSCSRSRINHEWYSRCFKYNPTTCGCHNFCSWR